MLAATGGYLGLAWLPGGDLDLAAAFDPQLVRDAGSLGAAAEAVCAAAGAPGRANWRRDARCVLL